MDHNCNSLCAKVSHLQSKMYGYQRFNIIQVYSYANRKKLPGGVGFYVIAAFALLAEIMHRQLKDGVFKKTQRPARIQLAAVDLDGTLLREDSSVSARSQAALRSFVGPAGPSGRTVVLASGQPPAQLLRNAAKVGIPVGYCIASSGATVVWGPTGAIVHRDWVSGASLFRLIPQIRELVPELRVTLECEMGWFTSNLGMHNKQSRVDTCADEPKRGAKFADFFEMLDRLMPSTGAKLRKIATEVPCVEMALQDGDGEYKEAVRLLALHPDSTTGSTDRLIKKLAPMVEHENTEYGSGLALGSPGGGEGALQITPVGVDKAKALRSFPPPPPRSPPPPPPKTKTAC